MVLKENSFIVNKLDIESSHFSNRLLLVAKLNKNQRNPCQKNINYSV